MIHILRFRMEDQICSKALTKLTVTFKISRVCFQVFCRSELCRIDKIGYHNDIVFLTASPYQACMPFM